MSDAKRQFLRHTVATLAYRASKVLRGIAGAKVRPESYARADIRAGSVGREQPAPRAEFDGDASWPPPAARA